MNQTPRALNRVVLAVCGLALMAAGALVVALAVFEPVARWWRSATAEAGNRLDQLLADTTLPGQPGSWVWLAAAGGLVVVLLLLLGWTVQQGSGRLGTVVVDYDGDGAPGIVSLGSEVAEQALKAALHERPNILHASVAAYEYRRVPGLRLRVLPRPGVAPQAVAADIMELVEALDQVVGFDPPVVLSIGAGARSRLVRADHRVH
ncbi:hypothetical protein LVY72_22095 [Arthrobacter sp. I2-34]|uniref:Alkaline shock response membrane anchor protein AmaP n=1 Tax=Arthrobacter hankyongi TaxID=2904801 RepID=A0ABS9LD20_9MICC|nr:hypothetical protein [Arthrobacter hankyongi]MCG2624586.1 hypothetical protein [Arthrobacter hankyongi]